MSSIPLRRSTSLVPKSAFWPYKLMRLGTAGILKVYVSARNLWHVAATVVVICDTGARSLSTPFGLFSQSFWAASCFWCRQTQWLAFNGKKVSHDGCSEWTARQRLFFLEQHTVRLRETGHIVSSLLSAFQSTFVVFLCSITYWLTTDSVVSVCQLSPLLRRMDFICRDCVVV